MSVELDRLCEHMFENLRTENEKLSSLPKESELSGRSWLISGPSQTGKTHLVTEACRRLNIESKIITPEYLHRNFAGDLVRGLSSTFLSFLYSPILNVADSANRSCSERGEVFVNSDILSGENDEKTEKSCKEMELLPPLAIIIEDIDQVCPSYDFPVIKKSSAPASTPLLRDNTASLSNEDDVVRLSRTMCLLISRIERRFPGISRFVPEQNESIPPNTAEKSLSAVIDNSSSGESLTSPSDDDLNVSNLSELMETIVIPQYFPRTVFLFLLTSSPEDVSTSVVRSVSSHLELSPPQDSDLTSLIWSVCEKYQLTMTSSFCRGLQKHECEILSSGAMQGFCAGDVELLVSQSKKIISALSDLRELQQKSDSPSSCDCVQSVSVFPLLQRLAASRAPSCVLAPTVSSGVGPVPPTLANNPAISQIQIRLSSSSLPSSVRSALRLPRRTVAVPPSFLKLLRPSLTRFNKGKAQSQFSPSAAATDAFAGISGLQDAKRALRRCLLSCRVPQSTEPSSSPQTGGFSAENILYEPMKFIPLNRGLRLRSSRGILLYGPPGTGKTLLARAAAEALGARFFNVPVHALLRAQVGESERLLRLVIRAAAAAQPSLLFIDEIQSLFVARETADDAPAASSGSSSSDGLGTNLTVALLHALDALAASEASVTVLAATNVPEALDPALLRPGRLDRLIFVGLPGFSARAHAFRTRLAGFAVFRLEAGNDTPVELDSPGREWLLDQLARYSRGASGADIAGIVQKAVSLSTLSFVLQSRMKSSLKLTEFEAPILFAHHLFQSLQVWSPSTSVDRIRELKVWGRSKKF